MNPNIDDELLAEPITVCDVEKRRECDSYYIKLYNELKKMYEKEIKRNLELREELENYKQLKTMYKEISLEVIDEISGKVVK